MLFILTCNGFIVFFKWISKYYKAFPVLIYWCDKYPWVAIYIVSKFLPLWTMFCERSCMLFLVYKLSSLSKGHIIMELMGHRYAYLHFSREYQTFPSVYLSLYFTFPRQFDRLYFSTILSKFLKLLSIVYLLMFYNYMYLLHSWYILHFLSFYSFLSFFLFCFCFCFFIEEGKKLVIRISWKDQGAP